VNKEEILLLDDDSSTPEIFLEPQQDQSVMFLHLKDLRKHYYWTTEILLIRLLLVLGCSAHHQNLYHYNIVTFVDVTVTPALHKSLSSLLTLKYNGQTNLDASTWRSWWV